MKKIVLMIAVTTSIFATDYILPQIPNEVENLKTLAGIDTNINGIRDDVEIYIQKNYNGSEKDCLMDAAIIAQELIVLDRTQENFILSINKVKKLLEKYELLFKNKPSLQAEITKIGDLTANTKERQERSL